MQYRSNILGASSESPIWIAPAAVALRLGISRAQVSRLAIRHSWKRLDVSTSPKAKNAGVRYAVSSIEEYERTHSY
jgi:hypothetical protein